MQNADFSCAVISKVLSVPKGRENRQYVQDCIECICVFSLRATWNEDGWPAATTAVAAAAAAAAAANEPSLPFP